MDPLKLLEQSRLIFSASEVDCAIDRVADAINATAIDKPLVIMCVMTGGLYFCGKLLSKLTMPVELDYVQVNRYREDLRGGDIRWTKFPTVDLNQKTVILVDDILDEGITLRAAYDQCVALGAAQVLTAVLTDKKNHQNKPISADFFGLEVPDAYVFGCGMDVHGWWRNLPEIRVL
ncbi:MAG: hypoxanthine-guanine phosphoribosyltransferase [Methylophilus sp.]|nr:hypoxanthine-guanine phosphoribosyltransferase [Methylophilus sp.]